MSSLLFPVAPSNNIRTREISTILCRFAINRLTNNECGDISAQYPLNITIRNNKSKIFKFVIKLMSSKT